MPRLIFFISLIHIVNCSCPNGFELVRDGQCRGFYKTISVHDNEAVSTLIATCKEIQADPVIIHTAEEQSYWTNVPKNQRLLLGLTCDPADNSKKWKWTDGTALDFKPPQGGSSAGLDVDCTTGCAWFMQNHDGFWYRWCDPDLEPFDIFCTKELQQPSDDGCLAFEDDKDDGVCYQVGAAAESWQEAQLNCRKLGANLASVHNQQENSFIRRLAVSKDAVSGVFLGATISGKGADFAWIDGTTWDYQNFHSGFPMVGSGECLAIDTSTSSGLWMNIDCTAELPVACIRDQKPIVNTCTDGPWTEGVIITSPGFPSSSNTSCDFFLLVDEDKKVEVEIVLLEANTCCDQLIIYDGFLGGHIIANLTGEVRNATYISTSNAMRVAWQPNGGINVLGVALTYHGV